MGKIESKLGFERGGGGNCKIETFVNGRETYVS